jgi:hypothetical protein
LLLDTGTRRSHLLSSDCGSVTCGTYSSLTSAHDCGAFLSRACPSSHGLRLHAAHGSPLTFGQHGFSIGLLAGGKVLVALTSEPLLLC